MAKMIKMSKECIEQIKQEFESMLLSGKFADGKVSYNKTFSSVSRPCTVYFTEIAWIKMQALIMEYDKEVAWHGIAYRGDSDKDEYTITDIIVYPQEVTGATVTTDQSKYQTWLMSHDDDVFNNIRMQGHSHVNMGVTPSVTDETLYEKFLSQLDETMFYIFLIYNKKGEATYKIYDLAKNIMFDTSDVTVEVIDDGLGIEEFLRSSKQMVKERVVVPQVSQFNKWQGSYYNYSKTTTPVTPQPSQAVKKEEPKNEPKQESKDPVKKEPEKKQKMKAYKKASERKDAKNGFGSYQRIDEYYDDYYDDFDSPYGPFGFYDGFYR